MESRKMRCACCNKQFRPRYIKEIKDFEMYCKICARQEYSYINDLTVETHELTEEERQGCITKSEY
jgi:hypothetical protein